MISKFVDRFKDLFSSDEFAIGTIPSGEFVKGINLGGEAVTLEGQRWAAYESALADGLTVPEANVSATQVKLNPTGNRDLRKMLNTVVYRSQRLEISQTLPNGRYDLYLWIMENYQTDWHSLEVLVAGQTIATGVGKLALGNWQRYGGYPVTVNQGLLEIALITHSPDVDAHLMGISIFRPVS
ncbi:MAG TPA: hypothetical protein V6C84_06245 [Coleofasciculaceae cyanobacterium]|jgi:hypothetical protein